MSKPKRPILRYHGGKWKLAEWVISNFPPHRVYIEPFGGGGSVLLQKQQCYSEVYNDLWGTVVNVFRVMRCPESAARLRQLIELTPFSREEFEQCGEEQISQIECPLERARRTIFRSFAGFGSASTNAKYATGFRANSDRSGTTPAHDWRNFPAVIPQFVDRLRGVVIENRPAAEVIAQHDREDALIYCDPPYCHSTRNMKRGNAAYECEMNDEDHRELAEVLNNIQGMAVLSGYPSDLYDELYAGWSFVERRAHADGARDRIERLWFNDNCAKRLSQKVFDFSGA